MESLSREHAARFAQVPRLTWVMARAYAPPLPGWVRVLWAAWSWPAYLLLVWLNWGSGTLFARPDGRAVLTATRAGAPLRRGLVALVPLIGIYVAVLATVTGPVVGLVDVSGPAASLAVQGSAEIVLAVVILLPVRPWLLVRNREAQQAVRRQQAAAPGPHWDIASLAAWPPKRGSGMELLCKVVTAPAATGTGWLVAREEWLVRIYRRAGWEVVEGSGGRGMTLKLGSRVG